ncbi:MAG: transcriptional repressor [Clostridia bacterium]|nr:transcriptional repressor [Clostridia bacterium]
MRETKQKTAILEFLRSKRQHCSASQIYDAVRVKIPNISLGTVYRNLSTLLESGEIISVETSDKSVFYDGFTHDHAHFVCQDCKNIFDFDFPSSAKIPLEEKGFMLDYERVVCYGKCPNCLKK